MTCSCQRQTHIDEIAAERCDKLSDRIEDEQKEDYLQAVPILIIGGMLVSVPSSCYFAFDRVRPPQAVRGPQYVPPRDVDAIFLFEIAPSSASTPARTYDHISNTLTE
jgi:hypothetical protein